MKLQILNIKLLVSLSFEIAQHRFAKFLNNQKFKELHKPNGLIYYEVDNLLEVKNLFQQFIKEYNFGGSNWIKGRVFDKENNLNAHISYNGRVWEIDNYTRKEI